MDIQYHHHRSLHYGAFQNGYSLLTLQSLQSLFTDNKDNRAIQLKEHFKSLKNGSLSIHDYCQTIKSTIDNLADVGHALTDKQLVLQNLHGLPKSYSTVVNLISFQNPLPIFLQTRSLLQMEETRLKEPDLPQPTVLYSQQPNPTPSPHPSNGRGNGYWRGSRGSSRGRGREFRPPLLQQHFGYNQYQQGNWHPPPPQFTPIPMPLQPLLHPVPPFAPPLPPNSVPVPPPQWSSFTHQPWPATFHASAPAAPTDPSP